MWKNHTYEWIFLRFTAIWSTLNILTLFYLFIISKNNVYIDIINLINIFQIIWNISTYLNLFLKILYLCTQIILIIHAYLGLINILQDYIHNNKTYNYIKILLLNILIICIKNIYVFIIIS